MPPYVLEFLIGVIAGLRSLTAAANWAARLGSLKLENTWLAFLGYAAAPCILSVLALVAPAFHPNLYKGVRLMNARRSSLP